MRKTIAPGIALILAFAGAHARAQFIFGTPANLGPSANSVSSDGSPDISADGLELYFDSIRPGGLGDWDIWVTKTTTAHTDWDSVEVLAAPVNSSYSDSGPCISADGLSLYFASERPGGHGGPDIWVTTRATAQEPWAEPVNLGAIVNSSSYDNHPSISDDGLTLYFGSSREPSPGYYDLFVTRRPTLTGAWQTPVKMIQGINTTYYELSPDISSDGLILFFDRRSVFGDRDILMATRPSAHSSWRELYSYGWPLNSWFHDTDPSISADDFVETQFVLDPQAGEFSIYAWIKCGAPGQVIISQATKTQIGRSWLYADPSDGKLMAGLRSAGQAGYPIGSQTVITDGLWHEIGFAWDGAYRYLYVDGQEVAADENPLPGLETADGGLFFGAGNTLDKGILFAGLIDDIRIYNIAVTP